MEGGSCILYLVLDTPITAKAPRSPPDERAVETGVTQDYPPTEPQLPFCVCERMLSVCACVLKTAISIS